MIIVEEGHKYQLANTDSSNCQDINFIKINSNGKRVDGTTNEEVLVVLIDRVEYLNSQFPCYENDVCLASLKLALGSLLHRTEDRIKRDVEGAHAL